MSDATSNPLKKLLRKSGMMLGLKTFAAILVLGMNVSVARYLGASEAGIFFLAYSLLNLVSGVCRLGYDRALVKYISIFKQDFGRVNKILFATLKVSSVLSVFAAVAIWIFSDILSGKVFNQSDIASTLRFAALTLPAFSCLWLFAYAFQGAGRLVLFVFYLSISIPLLLSGSIILLSPSTADNVLLILIVICWVLVASAFLMWMLISGRAPVIQDMALLGRFKQTARNLISIRVLTLVMQWGTPVLVGIWLTSSDVAVFTAAQRTAMITSLLLVAMNAVVAPKFARLYENGAYAELKNLAINSTRILAILGGALLIVVLVFSGEIMSAFGEEFSSGRWCLIVLSFGQYVNTATGSVGNLLQMTGHENYLRNNMFYSVAILCVGCWVFVPIYGVLAAAVVAAIAVAVQNLMGVWHVRRKLGFNTLKIW